MLDRPGYRVVRATSGREALAHVLRQDFSVVLLDVLMPGVDGLEACRRIRQQPWGQGMRIIAQTGWGQLEDRRRTEEAGFDGHIVKPLDPEALERVLGPSFRRRDPAGSQLYSAIASFNGVDRRTLTGTLGAGATPAQLAATGVPILFLVGREDALFPPPLVQQVQQRVPGSRYVEIPDAGHSAYFESPAAFNEAVLRFLEEAGVR